jgi:UDP-N-acetylmuramate dehydrogenase
MPKRLSTCTIEETVPLRDYTTWKVGGPARWLVECSSLAAIREALEFAHRQKCPFLPLGRGSNVLIADEGFDGLVMILRLEKLFNEGAWWSAGAGVSFAQMGARTAMDGWTGLEFAAGIPASVGGAVFMNAGAQGQETKDFLREVAVMWPDGSEQILQLDPADFSYRMSPFQNSPVILTSARFELKPDLQARARQLSNVKTRIATQPYDQPSAGCVFRNHSHISAGALIDSSGCKGLREGGAEVSCKHANFFVNTGEAKANDVLALISKVQEKVLAASGVLLHPEVRLVDSHAGWNPW